MLVVGPTPSLLSLVRRSAVRLTMAALLVVGCAADGDQVASGGTVGDPTSGPADTPTGSSAAAALSEDAYRAAANAACQREKDTLVDLPGADVNSTASLAAWFSRTIPAAETLADDIAALVPPPSFEEGHRQLVDALTDRVAAAEAMASAAAAADDATVLNAISARSAALDEAEDRAGEAEAMLGLDVCLVPS